MTRQRFYLDRTVHLLKRLLCLVPLALVATGCDVATNQTGGDWLSTRYGVRTPAPVTLEGLPLAFKLAGRDSGWLQESAISPLHQVGQWKGSRAHTMSWIAIDTATQKISRTLGWDSLALCLRLDTLPSRTRSRRMVRVVQVVRDSTSADSLALVNLFADRIPAFASVELHRDTLTIGPKDTLRIDPLPGFVRDTLAAHRRKGGVLVHLQPLDETHDGIIQVTSTFLRATKGAVVDTFDVGTVAGASARRGFVAASALSPATPTVQGGPAAWFLRLFPDTAKVRAEVAAALKARGLSSDLKGIAVLDATISFEADTSFIDSVGQRLQLLSVVNGNADVTAQLSIKGDSIQAFDSVVVRLDTATRSGDAKALLLRMRTKGGLADSLLLTRADTLSVAKTFAGLRTVCRRHGDTVEVIGKGVAAGLVEESQKDRSKVLGSGVYLGTTNTLAAQRVFSALLNWSDRQPEILLKPVSNSGTQWWQSRPKLGTAKLNLTLLPLGAAP